MMTNKTGLSVLNLLYTLSKDQPIKFSSLVFECSDKMGMKRRHTYNVISELAKEGFIKKEGRVKNSTCRITKEGMLARAGFEADRGEVHLDKRGLCSNCNSKAMLTWFKGKYLCRNCFIVGDSLRLEDFIYQSQDLYI